MDRVSDKALKDLIDFYNTKQFMSPHSIQISSALTELRERRAAEKVTITEPYDADWTSLKCPKCHHTIVCLDKFGYRCFTSGCGWTKDDPVKK